MFHMEPPWERGRKVNMNGLGHLTNMANIMLHAKFHDLRTISSVEDF